MHFCGMAKDKERATAKALFLQGKNQKDIAGLVGVQEKTIGNWVNKHGWKQQLDAKLNGSKSRIENLKNLIGVLTEERLKIEDDVKIHEGNTEKIGELRKRGNQIANEVAMYSKALQQLDEKNKVPLAVYLEIMDEIFKDLNKRYPRIFMQTLDFQDEHINTVSLKY